jgi:hypothetical protein
VGSFRVDSGQSIETAFGFAGSKDPGVRMTGVGVHVYTVAGSF